MKLTSVQKQIQTAPIVLLHGQPNTGKTGLSATCTVNGKPPLIILFEKGGTESLTKDNIDRMFGGMPDLSYDPMVLECFDDNDIDSIGPFLNENADEIKKTCGAIITDSLSTASKVALREIKGWGLAHGQQVYGALAERITGLCDEIALFGTKHGLPVIYHAQSVWSDEPGTENQILYPVFEGKKLLTSVPHDAYEVWCTFVDGVGKDGNPEYGLQLLREGNLFAKSRWGAVRKVKGANLHLGHLLEMKMGKRPVPADIQIHSKKATVVKPAAGPAVKQTGNRPVLPVTKPATK